MSAEVQRKPALQRRVDPVAAAVPDRVHAGETTSTAPAPAQPTHEPLNTSLQVRVRASCCLKQTSPVPRAVSGQYGFPPPTPSAIHARAPICNTPIRPPRPEQRRRLLGQAAAVQLVACDRRGGGRFRADPSRVDALS